MTVSEILGKILYRGLVPIMVGVLLPILLLTRPAMPSPLAPDITITREDDYLLRGQTDWVLAQSYASLRTNDLLRAVNRGDKCVLLRSTDGGTTWGDQQLVAGPQAVGDDRVRSTTVSTIYLKPDNGLLVLLLSDVITATGGGMAYGDAVGHGPRTGRILYQVSRDAGITWEAAQQLIEGGTRYNSRHWARDVWHGRSALGTEGQQVQRLQDGTMVVPAYLWPTDDYMARLFEAQGWPAELRRDAPYFLETRCLLLRWKPDRSGLTMASSAPIRLLGGYTPAGTCGSDESALAYLDDRHWLAVLRTTTSHFEAFEQRGLSMVRQCAYTNDGGKTWSTAEPLRFDDGGTIYSPSAWSQFIRSSKTGKWYWIGNILDEPDYGTCDPRYPLQIVELDAKTRRLKRETVAVIQDREPGDDAWVRFSNFRVYEERGSRDIILLMRKTYCELARPGLPSPSYRYRIVVGNFQLPRSHAHDRR